MVRHIRPINKPLSPYRPWRCLRAGGSPPARASGFDEVPLLYFGTLPKLNSGSRSHTSVSGGAFAAVEAPLPSTLNSTELSAHRNYRGENSMFCRRSTENCLFCRRTGKRELTRIFMVFGLVGCIPAGDLSVSFPAGKQPERREWKNIRIEYSSTVLGSVRPSSRALIP